ncbi:MAG: threonine/serine dehydratase [Alphaproteobacteria bacterium]
MIGRDDIEEAAARIASHIRATPTLALEPGALGLAARVVLKLELLQHAGSFKPRGAFNRILSARVPAAGVIAASGGNHGIATAYAARALGHAADIFVPEISSPIKIALLKALGARVSVVGRDYQAALEASQTRAAQTGALVVHAYDQVEVMAGQGTIGREFEAQAPDLDTVLVACGGGGLIGGIAAWYGGRCRIVSVEPERAASLARALEAGRPVEVEPSGIAADSLGARKVGALMFEIARAHVGRAVLVPDAAIRQAQLALWREMRLAAEPGAAAALGALLCGAYAPRPGERVGVLVCGGNVDPASLNPAPEEGFTP